MNFHRVFVVLAYVIALTLLALHAQEKDPSYHQTRQWIVGNIYVESPTTIGRGGNVVVIDTAGVCLYIVTGSGTIAAVPKTQLPKGAGCQ